MYVPQLFMMDPETDDVLMDGTELRADMIVLVFLDSYRSRINDHTNLPVPGLNESTEKARKKALQYNLWCKVTKLKVEGNSVKFLGVYENGLKFPFSASIDESWYVKKDSVPVEAPKKDSYQVGKEIGYSAGHKNGYDDGYLRGKADGYNRAIQEFGLNTTAPGNEPDEIEPATGLKITPSPRAPKKTFDNQYLTPRTSTFDRLIGVSDVQLHEEILKSTEGKPSLKYLTREFDVDELKD